MRLKSRLVCHHGLVRGVLFSMILFGALTCSAQPGQKRPSPPPSRTPIDPFLDPATGPVTLVKLLELLQRVKEDTVTEGRILRAIEARGVDFPMTPGNTKTIASAGGSARLIDVLARKSPPPPDLTPTPAKKEEPTGGLVVQCEPAECEITIRGGLQMVTKNGTARMGGLKVGESLVEILKPGYLSQQRSVTIKASSNASLRIALEPDANTQAEFGSRLLKAMVDAAGGQAARKDLAAFTATGSATLFDTAGSGTEWNLTVTFRGGQATFEAKNSAGGLKLECRGETCQAQSGGRPFARRLSSEQAQNLETNLRQFRTYQFAALLDRMLSASPLAKAQSANVPGPAEQHLRLEGKSEAYNIVLDAQMLPALVTFESKTGLGSGLVLAFANYAKLGTSHYPQTTEIKFPDGKQGLRIRFGQISPQN